MIVFLTLLALLTALLNVLACVVVVFFLHGLFLSLLLMLFRHTVSSFTIGLKIVYLFVCFCLWSYLLQLAECSDLILAE